jgi:SAM-dependent methyltransferase
MRPPDRSRLPAIARRVGGSRPARFVRDRAAELGSAREEGRLVRCPICDHRADEFLPFGTGDVKRPGAQCPGCGALERHRLVWLYLLDETDLFSGSARRRMLHLAPEPMLEPLLRGDARLDYVSADIEPGVAQEQMDVTDIRHPDASFDVIYASHVLEHVPDDALAMGELHRVLRPGGWAILQVPILYERTDEDPTITDPQERLRRFAQIDHVRVYGLDYADRLRAAGFDVLEDHYPERLGPVRSRRYGLHPGDVVFFCRRT